MNALMWPTEPCTTMSTPFIEMPQRAAALPRITSRPPRPVAPADCDALPSTITVPDMMFSATPTPGVAVHAHGRLLVHAGAVVARVALDLDLDGRVDPDRERVRAARVQHAPVARGRVVDRVQRGVQLAQRRDGQVELGSLEAAPESGHQTVARSQL